MQIDHKEILSVAYADNSRNHNIGVELSYPKEVFYKVSSKSVFTDNFSTYFLLENLIKRIKTSCKKAKAKRDGKISKPNFWVSKKSIIDINNNVMLKKNKIILL